MFVKRNEFASRSISFLCALLKPVLKPLAYCILPALLLSACTTTLLDTGRGGRFQNQLPQGPETLPVLPSSGLGAGSYKIGLLLPTSAPGQGAIIAQSLRNAVEMALADTGTKDVQILPFDTLGTPDGAIKATQDAVSQGAKFIIGPVFSPAVKATRQTAAISGVPVIAFSTDATAAGNGTFLLSFLPRGAVERVVSYAVKQGKTSIAGIVPDSGFGGLAEAALRETAPRAGGRVTSLVRYQGSTDSIRQAVGSLAGVIGGKSPSTNALLVPDTAGPAALIAKELPNASVEPGRIKYLGSGTWYDPKIWNLSAYGGAWFAAPDPSAWERFRLEYRGRYNSDPNRLATLAYDATSLVAALVRVRGGNVTQADLTSSTGFNGVDGIFRFLPNGENQRGLAILEIRNGSTVVVDRAPANFNQAF